MESMKNTYYANFMYLIKWMLIREPEKRPYARQVLAYLEHLSISNESSEFSKSNHNTLVVASLNVSSQYKFTIPLTESQKFVLKENKRASLFLFFEKLVSVADGIHLFMLICKVMSFRVQC
jgi:hypothetical protein